MKKQTHKTSVKSVVIKPFLFSALVGLSNITYSAPGNLADTPLFIANHVQPNINVLLDDSGSMGWGYILNKGADFADPNYPYVYYCAGWNLLTYDPNVLYSPWKGKDSSGNFYTDRTLASVCSNPYDNASCNGNITTWVYFEWNDADDDGEYDIGECGSPTDWPDGIALSTLPATVTSADAGYPHSQENFANWYSYYRIREYTAKKAISEVFDATSARVGLYGINRLTGGNVVGPVSTAVLDLGDSDDDDSDGVSNGDENRETLFTNLFAGSSDSGTPLRSALKAVGDILEGVSSPINNKCQANYTLVMTDGYWNGADPTLGDTDSDDNTDYDGGSYADGVRYCHEVDTTYCVTPEVYATFTNNNADTYLDKRDYDEITGISNTLADVAMYFYERDLSATYDDEVPTDASLDDTNPAQHMNTFTLSFGLDGTLTDNPTNYTDPFLWPIPVANTDTTIDDLRHAAWNGRGQYLSAKNPQEMIDALNAAFLVFETKSSAASVAFNSKSLGTNSYLYLAIFDSSDWSGDLIAYALDPVTGNIAADASWNSATVINNQLSTVAGLNSRVVVTGKRDPATNAYSSTALNSSNWANLSTEIQDDFKAGTTPASVVATSDLDGDGSIGDVDDNAIKYAQLRIDYMRGDQTHEIGESGGLELFRAREIILGDIVDSAPVYVGKPTIYWPSPVDYVNCDAALGYVDSESPFPKFTYDCKDDVDITNDDVDYTGTFKEYKEYTQGGDTVVVNAGTDDEYSHTYYGQKDRAGIVYFGANDGMLHGVYESDGSEAFAYMPQFLASANLNSGLHYLTESTYQHTYYVDLEPTVNHVQIPWDHDNDAATADVNRWRTILVAGGRGGGRGIFALDVTNDEYNNTDTDASNGTTGPSELLLWEFSNEDYPNLGYTFSKPYIAPVPYTVTVSGSDKLVTSMRWAVIFGNGYNPDTALAGATGEAELIVLFLDADLSDGWTLGTDFKVISTDTGTLASLNGLSSPTVTDDYNSDFVADQAYAGDLFGNLWAFDLSGAPADWKVAYDDGAIPAVPKPLFTTSGVTQPITTRPRVVTHPSIADDKDTASAGYNQPNNMILFGTGQYLTAADVSNTDSQTFYGVWDKGTGELTRANLDARSFDDDGSASGFRIVDDATVDYTTEYGWHLDMPVAGERMVTNAVPRLDIIYFNTSIPDGDSCTAGGDGWEMGVTILDGDQPTEPFFDVNGDGEIDENDLVNDAVVSGIKFDYGLPTSPSFLGNKKYTPGSDTGSGDEVGQTDVESGDSAGMGRTSWNLVNPETGRGFD